MSNNLPHRFSARNFGFIPQLYPLRYRNSPKLSGKYKLWLNNPYDTNDAGETFRVTYKTGGGRSPDTRSTTGLTNFDIYSANLRGEVSLFKTGSQAARVAKAAFFDEFVDDITAFNETMEDYLRLSSANVPQQECFRYKLLVETESGSFVPAIWLIDP